MTKQRKQEILKLIREQIVTAIKLDLDGTCESLMKEVWEQLDGDDEFKIANDELREIIAAIEFRGA